MYVHFVRSGGFAGFRLECKFDSSSLTDEEVQALRNEVDKANFFAQPEQITGVEGADRFQYEITVQRGDQSHTIVAEESALPEDFQPLIQHLEQLARSRR